MIKKGDNNAFPGKKSYFIKNHNKKTIRKNEKTVRKILFQAFIKILYLIEFLLHNHYSTCFPLI